MANKELAEKVAQIIIYDTWKTGGEAILQQAHILFQSGQAKNLVASVMHDYVGNGGENIDQRVFEATEYKVINLSSGDVEAALSHAIASYFLLTNEKRTEMIEELEKNWGEQPPLPTP